MQIEIIKAILNLDDVSYEPLITIKYNNIRSKVLNYCNRTNGFVPEALENLILEIAIEQLKNEFAETQTVQGTGELKSKTIGDVKYEYDVGTSVVKTSTNSNSFLNNFEQHLKPYVLLGMY